jgi:hypothetical protein
MHAHKSNDALSKHFNKIILQKSALSFNYVFLFYGNTGTYFKLVIVLRHKYVR